MSNWLSLRNPLGLVRLAAAGAIAAWSTQCDLKHGDHGLPDTSVTGLEHQSVLRLLTPPDVRRIGAVIPITVEATFPEETSTDARFCVRLAGTPGRLVFPFGDRCLADTRLSPTRSDASGGAGGAGGEQNGGASGSPTEDVDPALHVSQSCIAPTATFKDEHEKVHVAGTLHAAYFAGATEQTASLFGALYANKDCKGEPITSTAVLLDLHDPTPDTDAQGGANGSGGTGGSGGVGGTAGSGGTDTGGSGGTGGTGPGVSGAGGTGGDEPLAGASGVGGV